jgi:CheY-like chemotaxis protein
MGNKHKEDFRRLNRVLVVDDRVDIRMVLDMLLTEEGFDVVGEAADGHEAIDGVLRYHPDIVILDREMPGMNGEEAAPQLREIDPKVRIVAFSASLREVPDWADAFLPKERITELADLLRTVPAAV